MFSTHRSFVEESCGQLLIVSGAGAAADAGAMAEMADVPYGEDGEFPMGHGAFNYTDERFHGFHDDLPIGENGFGDGMRGQYDDLPPYDEYAGLPWYQRLPVSYTHLTLPTKA